MAAELYNDWWVSPEWSDVGPSYGSYSDRQKYNALKVYAEARKTVNIDLVFYSYHSKDGKLFMFYGSDIKEVQ